MATITGLQHIVVFCVDTAASRAFYEQLGFVWLRSHADMHWLDFGAGTLMLHPLGGGEAARGAVPQFYLSIDDVDGHFAALRAAGISPRDHLQPGIELEAPVTRPWGTREFEVVDPDGLIWAFSQAGDSAHP